MVSVKQLPLLTVANQAILAPLRQLFQGLITGLITGLIQGPFLTAEPLTQNASLKDFRKIVLRFKTTRNYGLLTTDGNHLGVDLKERS